ncbi:MAG: segregation and condensation protein A [Acidiferrobacteraceae bacterium]|jgi:ABC-type lipopolysaccharide export system ATPase subunit
MSDPDLSKEERILRVVKIALTNVIKDTATMPGMRHPLQDSTIEDLRQSLALISARERELADAAGRPMAARPRYMDEPVSGKNPSIVRFVPRKPKPDAGE